MTFFSKELTLQQASPAHVEDIVIDTTTVSPITIQYGGLYRIKVQGAGGGGCSAGGSWFVGGYYTGASGGAGGYCDVNVRISGGSSISFFVSNGGSSLWMPQTTGTVTAPDGLIASISINGTTIASGDGGKGGTAGMADTHPVAKGGSTFINTNYLTQHDGSVNANVPGADGLVTVGWNTGHNPLGRTYAPYDDSVNGKGSGGAAIYSAPTNGYDGAIKLTYLHS